MPTKIDSRDFDDIDEPVFIDEDDDDTVFDGEESSPTAKHLTVQI